MNLLKKIFIGCCLFVFICSLFLWFLTDKLDPRKLENFVRQELKSLTNKESHLEGSISWEIFPRPRLKISGVHIGSDKDAYQVDFKNLLFNLKVASLLQGDIIFNELHIDGFKVVLHSEPALASSELMPSFLHSNLLSPLLNLKRILLSNGQIEYKSNHSTMRLLNVQIGTDQFNIHKRMFPFQFKANLETTSSDKRLIRSAINFKGSTALTSFFFENPILALENSSISGQLLMQDFLFNLFKINKLSAYLKIKNGTLSLNPLTINSYQGESVGDLNYEFASEKLSINQTATNLNGSDLTQDILNTKLFKGSIDISLHTQSDLKGDNWLQETSGMGNMTIKEGIIETFNLDKVIDEISRNVEQLFNENKENISLSMMPLQNPTLFQSGTKLKLLTIQFLLNNAQLKTDTLILQTETLNVQGKGEINLFNKYFESHLLAKLTAPEPPFDKLQAILGGNFPLLIKGTLANPIILPDFKEMPTALKTVLISERLGKTLAQL